MVNYNNYCSEKAKIGCCVQEIEQHEISAPISSLKKWLLETSAKGFKMNIYIDYKNY